MDEKIGKNPDEELSTGLKILAFIIPLAGIIMFFMYRGEYPRKSSSACKISILAVLLVVLIRVISICKVY